MIFNEKYTKYWEKAVQKSVDGTLIPDHNEVLYYIDLFELKKFHRSIDVGCSTGRMFDIIKLTSNFVYGIDPDPYALMKASQLGYTELKKANSDEMGFSSNFFDFVFCWAVFDVVKQFETILEANRLLERGGKFMFTGKGSAYSHLDKLAFTAEKNAYLKGFPNKFNDINQLCRVLRFCGFDVIELVTFAERGSMGRREYIRHDIKNIPIDERDLGSAYEFLILAQKHGKPKNFDLGQFKDFSTTHSRTATDLARRAGYANVPDFFNSLGGDQE